MKLTLLIGIICLSGILSAQTISSSYVPVEDGTRLAVDVHFPEMYTNEKLPVLLMFTRYWRSSLNSKTKKANPPLDDLDKLFSDHGYVIVKVDARGTGASFGTRVGEYTPIEVMDAKSILDWVVSQTWSNGNIGAYGTSYEGTTAELLCATNHPAVKAVIPGWSDFDIYRSPTRPYGLLASSFIKKWSMYVSLLDKNASLLLRESVRPVDENVLKQAISEHKENPNVYKITKNAPFRNSTTGVYTYEDCSPLHWKDEIEKSNVPMLVLTSWMDAGTAEGTLLRLEHYSNPQKVLMMATSHGGWSNASPFEVGDSPLYPKPMKAQQNKSQLDFFDYYLKGIDTKVEEWPTITYYNLGEEKFKRSDVWPIEHTVESPFYFQEDGALTDTKPTSDSGVDHYKVDFSVSTGEKNRWTTQMGGPVLNLNERNEMDARMLTYTSKPMVEDLQITGTPIAHLQLSSSHKDGAVFLYLEDVDEKGVSRYITEGALRLIHRKLLPENENQFNLHSFAVDDALKMEPGAQESVVFRLWPTSVLIEKGHSIRISISGADKDTFDKVPKQGKPTITMHRNALNFSYVTLPVIMEN